MKVLVVGDLHCNPWAARQVVNATEDHEVGEVWQVGDFGYWPGKPVYDKFIGHFDDLNVPLLFADGNHENHAILRSGSPGLVPRPINAHVTHMPRGYVHDVDGLKIMFFGGARSVDRIYRRAYESWFPEELPTPADWERAAETDTVDVVVAHDAPPAQDYFYNDDNPIWPIHDILVGNDFRRELEELRARLQPSVWFHGHHHQFQHTTHDGTEIWGLREDATDGCFALFDTESLEVTPIGI